MIKYGRTICRTHYPCAIIATKPIEYEYATCVQLGWDICGPLQFLCAYMHQQGEIMMKALACHQIMSKQQLRKCHQFPVLKNISRHWIFSIWYIFGFAALPPVGNFQRRPVARGGNSLLQAATNGSVGAVRHILRTRPGSVAEKGFFGGTAARQCLGEMFWGMKNSTSTCGMWNVGSFWWFRYVFRVTKKAVSGWNLLHQQPHWTGAVNAQDITRFKPL